MNEHADAAGFEALLELLRATRGFDFTGYKRPSLMRRVERRMQAVGAPDYAAYGKYLQAHGEEFALLFNTILINVTSFFRDARAWDFVRAEVVPAILAAKGEHGWVRVWSAGCATGEEAYTLAIVLAEAMGAEDFRRRARIYATDADEEALQEARRGSYAARSMAGLEAGLRSRYFEAAGERFVFRADLRRSVIFGRQNLVHDAPISRLDLLACRNTIMYFDARSQALVLEKFHYALNDESPAFFFLGRAEMLLTHAPLFAPVDLKSRVFRKVPQPGCHRPPPAAPPERPPPSAYNGLPMSLHDQSAEEMPLARIVVDANGALTLANQRARALFGLSPDDLGRPLKDLEISYRPAELRSMIEQAYAEGLVVAREGAERRFPDGQAHYFDVAVAPFFDDRTNPLGVSITFLDVTHLGKLKDELRRAREEIQTATEELQASNEELETTNEELQSTNEELETMNEELQSTNEELQSTNEELQAVNVELRQGTRELDRAKVFLESVLRGLRSGAVVVNGNFDILVWNERAADLWGLRADEVKGRSFLDLEIGLPAAEVRAAARPCLSGEAEHSEIVFDTVNRRGKKFRCRVSCTPLMGPDGARAGVILLMEDAERPAA